MTRRRAFWIAVWSVFDLHGERTRQNLRDLRAQQRCDRQRRYENAARRVTRR